LQGIREGNTRGVLLHVDTEAVKDLPVTASVCSSWIFFQWI